MNQNIWGPQFWFMLHSITLNYPLDPTEKDKNNIKIFFTTLSELLPCSKCAKNFKKNLVEMPIKCDNRRELFEWMIDIHNEINGREGKKYYDYDVVHKYYEKIYMKKIILNNNNKNNNNNLFIKIKNNLFSKNMIYIYFILLTFSFIILKNFKKL